MSTNKQTKNFSCYKIVYSISCFFHVYECVRVHVFILLRAVRHIVIWVQKMKNRKKLSITFDLSVNFHLRKWAFLHVLRCLTFFSLLHLKNYTITQNHTEKSLLLSWFFPLLSFALKKSMQIKIIKKKHTKINEINLAKMTVCRKGEWNEDDMCMWLPTDLLAYLHSVRSHLISIPTQKYSEHRHTHKYTCKLSIIVEPLQYILRMHCVRMCCVYSTALNTRIHWHK